MKEALVFIGFGEIGGKVQPFAPYNLVIGEDDRSSSKQNLEGELLTFYQDFKGKGAKRVRYLILCAPEEQLSISLQEVYRVVADLHREVILLPFETEAFILLPSVKTDRSAKARCYRFFETIEKNSSKGIPELMWLLDTDRVPDYLASDVLALYLSTDVYRSLNAQMQAKMTKEKGRQYSSLGVARLVFPAQQWHKYLSLMLARDLVSVRQLSPLTVDIETARMSLSQVLPFLKAKFAKISEVVSKPATFPQAEVLLEGIAVDEKERMKKFLARLKLHINQEKARRWEEMKPDAEIFFHEVKKELDSIINGAPHGLYSAWGFIGLLLVSGGPYMAFIKDLESWPEDFDGVSIQSSLFGWQEKIPSPVLDLLFREVREEVRQFYLSRFLPFPEPTTWKALFEELCRLLELPELEKIIGEGKKFIEALKEKIEVIVKACGRSFTSPLSGKNLEDILDLLEIRAREYLESVIQEVSPVTKKFEELEKKIAALGWKKYLPWFWPLVFSKWEQKAAFERAKMMLRKAYLQVLERRRNLFACYFGPFAAERLVEFLKPLAEEIMAFASLVGENRSSVDRNIVGMDFSLPPFGFQVVEWEEDIKGLYFHQFAPQDIPQLFDELVQSFKEPGEPPPKLSDFYTPAEKRKLFVEGLFAYSLYKFAWVQDWDVRKVIAHLKKADEMASLLEKKSETFLQVKDPMPADLQTALFLGLDNQNRNPFSSSAFSSPEPLCYSHGNAEVITGLRLSYGFPAASIEGWEHWKTCAESKKRKG